LIARLFGFEDRLPFRVITPRPINLAICKPLMLRSTYRIEIDTSYGKDISERSG